MKNFKREDLVNLLPNENNIGIELGVAEGVFAERIFKSNKFSYLFGVDMYSDHHDVSEYKMVIKKIGLFTNYKLLRMTFDEAYDLFENNFFDFIYIDGYAGNGEEGGTTIFQWIKKLKIGGILAGDDYDSKQWPLVVEAVNQLCEKGNYELLLTEVTEKKSYCKYPSWALIKTHDFNGSPSTDLIEKSKNFKIEHWIKNQKES